MCGVILIELCISQYIYQSYHFKVSDTVFALLDFRSLLSLAVAVLSMYLIKEERERRWRLGE